MEVFILISVVFIMGVAANRTVEQECLECVNEKKMTFYKTVWASKDPPQYSCRKYAYLVSKFGYVVDTACIESECQNITLRLHYTQPPLIFFFLWAFNDKLNSHLLPQFSSHKIRL
jgi:hypothetical protein